MTPFNDKVTCSCLRVFLDDRTLSFGTDDVVTKILGMFPNENFATMARADFKPFYVEATNAMARATEHYKLLTDDARARLEQRFAKRCGACGINLLADVRERQSMLLEAA